MTRSHDGMSRIAQSPEQSRMRCDGTFPLPNDTSSSTAIIAATTRSNINRAIELRRRGLITEIIGTDPAYSTTPSDALRKLEGDAGIHTIIVFSDQLTSSLDAPVLTSHHGQQRYLPLAEGVLNSIHEFQIMTGTCDDTITLPPCSPITSVLRTISNHLDSNQKLGGDWLAQPVQTKRWPATRLAESRFRQRVFHSALMHMYWKHPDFNPKHFDWLHGQLKNLYRASQRAKEVQDARKSST